MPKPYRKLILATCTVGEGSDVLIVDTHSDSEGKEVIFYTDLTVAEARNLATQLLLSATRAEEFYLSYEQWCKDHPESNKE